MFIFLTHTVGHSANLYMINDFFFFNLEYMYY